MELPSSSQTSQDDTLSSLPASSPLQPQGNGSRRPKKPPPVTPRRFTKFFTPRSKLQTPAASSTSSRKLRDITHNAVNRGPTSRRKAVAFADVDSRENVEPHTPQVTPRRKRSGFQSPESSPILPSPSKRARISSKAIDETVAGFILPDSSPPPIFEDEESPKAVPPTPVRRLKSSRPARILEREFGGRSALSRGFRRDHCSDSRSSTANFYSLPQDCHPYDRPTLPFCSAACNTNSIVAIGDEIGGIRLIDSDERSSEGFAKIHLSIQPHINAVMDLAFSSNDLLLACGGGDQTARVIDVQSQHVIHVLAGHTSSVKQVRFQPGNDHVLATSSRDGHVKLWDLRCSGSAVTQFPETRANNLPIGVPVYNNIPRAHHDHQLLKMVAASYGHKDVMKSKEIARRWPDRVSDISVTALSFLSADRSNLLLTASEASTCVKLWDIRGTYSRRGPAVPISTTRQPDSHNQHRQFGINSVVLNGDQSRLYALSRDQTVYAYSTSHLVLGHAPELFSSFGFRSKYRSSGKEGLGPLYGFRHPSFHATSFYVKAALRKAKDDKPEMLAVGSTDGTPILFPTDESLLQRASVNEKEEFDPIEEAATPVGVPANRLLSALERRKQRPKLSRTSSLRLNDTIPIYENGTALVRGHTGKTKEVTSLTWTSAGDLVSVGDDFLVRCWREGPADARDLRTCGEGGGRRWACGWAEAPEGYDDNEG